MTLRQKQSIFAVELADLIMFIVESKYEVTFGEVQRSEEEAKRLKKLGKGIYPSLHMYRLAADLNLFKDGKYLSSTKSHERFGEYWESKSGELEFIWGGRFSDGNHYSIGHAGLK